MSSLEFAQSLVILNIPPSLEEAVVDWLLARRGENGFTSHSVFGHSSDHDTLSAAEQVSGRQRRLQFLIQMSSESVNDFLREARDRFGTTNTHYWVLPISGSGSLDQAGETQ